ENNKEKTSTTKKSLLEAAGNIFAQKGYNAATVREISKSAKANLASINYYFGDKKKLYYAVIKDALDYALEKFPPNMGIDETVLPEKKLHTFVRSFLLRILDDGRPSWHGKLLTREISEPTSALDLIVEEIFKPLHRRLSSIVGELLDMSKIDSKIRFCTFSIIGQCLFYCHSRSVIMKIYSMKLELEEIEVLANHITDFSLTAIKGLSKKQ
ncbi:CerR family C-terminal domain-containing protein, partial [bacterium]|nr:CerR family C-terminal domain-containing protein [bacterium]